MIYFILGEYLYTNSAAIINEGKRTLNLTERKAKLNKEVSSNTFKIKRGN